ncbi:MAG: hypothetical protein GTO30_04330, partial [Acidobacteria bacterium]|nr:hypothetical protein [Acidobacteriota bacterium]NIQ85554.1 hypothetical protein [Acidobacteriota bacterium]
MFSLLAVNLTEASFSETPGPALVLVLLTLAGWLVLAPVIAEKQRRAIVLTALWVPFWTWGYALDRFREGDTPTRVGVVSIAAGLLIVAVVAGIALVKS